MVPIVCVVQDTVTVLLLWCLQSGGKGYVLVSVSQLERMVCVCGC